MSAVTASQSPSARRTPGKVYSLFQTVLASKEDYTNRLEDLVDVIGKYITERYHSKDEARRKFAIGRIRKPATSDGRRALAHAAH